MLYEVITTEYRKKLLGQQNLDILAAFNVKEKSRPLLNDCTKKTQKERCRVGNFISQVKEPFAISRDATQSEKDKKLRALKSSKEEFETLVENELFPQNSDRKGIKMKRITHATIHQINGLPNISYNFV